MLNCVRARAFYLKIPEHYSFRYFRFLFVSTFFLNFTVRRYLLILKAFLASWHIIRKRKVNPVENYANGFKGVWNAIPRISIKRRATRVRVEAQVCIRVKMHEPPRKEGEGRKRNLPSISADACFAQVDFASETLRKAVDRAYMPGTWFNSPGATIARVSSDPYGAPSGTIYKIGGAGARPPLRYARQYVSVYARVTWYNDNTLSTSLSPFSASAKSLGLLPLTTYGNVSLWTA